MDRDVFPFLTQLAGQAPGVLLYFVAIVLALVFWRRCPVPALLTLIAAGLRIGTTLLQLSVSYYLWHGAQAGLSMAEIGWISSAAGLVGSLLRAVAFGLLVAAVFIGRKEPPRPLG